MKFGKYILAAMMVLGFANVAFAEEVSGEQKATVATETTTDATETTDVTETAEAASAESSESAE